VVGAIRDLVHHKGRTNGHETHLVLVLQKGGDEVNGYLLFDDLPVAFQGHMVAIDQFHEHHIEFFDSVPIHGQDLVPRLDPELGPDFLFGDPNPVLETVHGNILIAVGIGHPDINEYGQYKVDGHPAEHDDQPLPGEFAPDFLMFGLFLHPYDVPALIEHARQLYIAAQGQPADTIYRISYLFLVEGVYYIEKEIALCYPDPKDHGRDKVSKPPKDNK